jgi:hypothetical protein
LQHLFQNGHESDQRPQYLRRRVSLTLIFRYYSNRYIQSGAGDRYCQHRV